MQLEVYLFLFFPPPILCKPAKNEFLFIFDIELQMVKGPISRLLLFPWGTLGSRGTL